jgi:MscS family membrane protein
MINSWLHRFLPGRFFHYGPKGLMWWQWLAIPIAAVLALAIGRLLGEVTRRILQRLFKRTRTEWDDRLFARVGRGLNSLWAIAIFRLMLPSLELPDEAAGHVNQVLSALVVATVFWALWRSTDVFFEMMMARSWAHGNASARSLLSFVGNVTRAAIGFIGVVCAVGALGFPVTTVLAGVGIGGIALAFGAQKTVENLFGSLALATDQPFRVGDNVKIDGISGTVERVGMRSTRIRTPDRSLVTFPNGRLADMRIETLAARDRIRFATTVGVAPSTSEAQLVTVIQKMDTVLRSHPKIWPDSVVVRLAGFAATAIEIEVECWFATADPDTFRAYRQDVLLAFMRGVEQAGTSFAVTPQSLQLVAPGPVSMRQATDANPS